MNIRPLLLAVCLFVSAPPALAEDASSPDCSYPVAERRAGIEGAVVLDITVAADGSVENAQIAQSSGNDELDQVAARCAKAHWHYKPATKNGAAVEAHTKARVTWKIQ